MRILADEIEKGEQVDPDQVDQVPVEADQVHRGVVGARKVTTVGSDHDPGDQDDADQHVEAMDARHGEVEAEKHGLLGRATDSRQVEEPAGQQTIVELVGVLEVFDDEEGEGKAEGQAQVENRLRFLVGRGIVNRHYHRKGGTKEENRVHRAENPVEMMVTGDPGLRIDPLHEAESDEEAAEHQDLRGQKKPHADLRRIELLFGGSEVMLAEPVFRHIMRRMTQAFLPCPIGR